MEEQAIKRDLIASFTLLAASSLLTIPFERMKSNHFLHDKNVDKDLAAKRKELEKAKFLSAAFWGTEPPKQDDWRQFKIVSEFKKVFHELDGSGSYLLTNGSENAIEKKSTENVLRVIRNALAHGNIVYLNSNGEEICDEQVYFFAFLSRYEESQEQKDESETYRIIITKVDEFLRFTKLWAKWISKSGDK